MGSWALDLYVCVGLQVDRSERAAPARPGSGTCCRYCAGVLNATLTGAPHPVVLKNSAALIAGLLPAWCILGDAILSCLHI